MKKTLLISLTKKVNSLNRNVNYINLIDDGAGNIFESLSRGNEQKRGNQKTKGTGLFE